MIARAHNDWWLIVAVLARHAIFVPLKIKCYIMTANLRLHCSACCCNLQVLENISAQLQQQLAQKGTDLSSAEQSLAHLEQELTQAQHSKHEATKVKLVLCLHHDKTPLHMATGCITAVAYPPS